MKTKPEIVSEVWCKLITYSDDTTKLIPYPDHRKNSDPPYDGPPNTWNGGLSHNEQYADPDRVHSQGIDNRLKTSGVFSEMYDKLHED